ncbi:MAG: hypothetical protein IJR99_00725 [Kiritimatiellae bacterium]|nr:hypothetical protein [Kiritimatiellia bacterium]
MKNEFSFLVPALCLMFASLSAKAETAVLYYPFCDVPNAVTVSTPFTNRVAGTPLTAYPLTLNNAAVVEGSSECCPVATNGLADGYCVFDSQANEKVEAATALHFHKTTLNGKSGVLRVQDPAALRLTTFTVECFIRMQQGTVQGNWNAVAVMPGKLYNGGKKINNCDSWGIRVTGASEVQVRFTKPDYTLKASGDSVSSGNTAIKVATPGIYDGNWHHLAVMVEGKETTTPPEEEGGEPTVTESSEIRIYYDYIWRTTQTIGWKVWYGEGEDLYIGATPQTAGPFGGSIAHFRISDFSMYVADMLRPARFVPAVGETDDVFLHYSFETPPTGPANSFIDETGRQRPIDLSQHMYADTCLSVPGIRSNVATPGEWIRYSLTNALARANPSVLYTRPIQGKESDTKRYVAVLPGEDPFTNHSFTVECFYRSNAEIGTYIPLVRRPGGSNVQFNLGFNPAGTVSGAILMTPSGSTIVSDVERTDDGEWHHAAVVVDAPRHRISLFRDYRRVRSAAYTGEVIPSTSPIYIGGSTDGNYNFNGWIDEVRITLRALEPGEFLTSEEYFDPAARTLAWATFDSDFSAAPALGDPVSTNLTEAGTIPSIAALNTPLPVFDGHGQKLRMWNTGALSIQTGSVTYARATLLSLFPDQTVELRVRAAPQPYYASFARANYAFGDMIPAWSFGFSHDGADPDTGLSTNLSVRCATLAENGTVNIYGVNDPTWVNITDGRWHHLALTMRRFQEGGVTKSTVCLYKDYEATPSFTKTVNGILYGNGHGEIKLGESSSAAYFSGEVDELRISQGVLDPVEFLRVTAKGTVISVR